MSDIKLPLPSSESKTITIIGPANAPVAGELPDYSTASFTLPSENIAPSQPISEGAVRVGNSVLSARVPESAILRDESGDF
jgi:hypothetical protein